MRIFAHGEILDGLYEITEVLGTGGMGQVYAAMDLRLEREVAVKACWPRIGRSVLRAEAKVLAALRHPGIVTVHAIGTHGGVDYVVMERLHGLTLCDHLQQRGPTAPFSVEETLDVLIDVADTLAVVHRTGYVHRDLKPSNIMLAPSNRVVLLDLGVSLRNDQAEHEDKMAGSPHYMAPEAITASMARGQGHLIDIYALGVIAFEMLTCRRPFEHQDMVKLLEMQLHRQPPRVSDYMKSVPVQLARLIGEILRKEPHERPQSVEVVSAWLRGIRRGQPNTDPSAPIVVLIADDDPDMRALVASFVEQALPNVSIRLAADGRQALEQFRRSAPDVAILDLDMPYMTGLELCMYVRGTAQAAETTLVAVSGEASPADRALLEHLGVARFINKTSSADIIFGQLVNLLRSIAHTRSRVLAA
jgi:serine/threonine-protein kinase